MKNLTKNPFASAGVLYGVICLAVMLWMLYRPEIQDALRTAQNLIFWWQR